MNVRIRPMEGDDAEGVGRMHHRAWVDTYGPFLPPDYFDTSTVADRVRRWSAILAEPPGPGVVRLLAESGDGVAGFVTVGPTRQVEGRPNARPAELWALYVAQEWLGSGLGQQLLDACLAREQPCELWVFEANMRARRFYARNGFSVDGATFTDETFPTLLEVRMVR